MKKLLLFLCILISASTVFAQNTGMIRGEVFDENGLLPGVEISVSGISTHYLSDSDGAFSFSLEPGDYEVMFSFPDYNTEVKKIQVIGKTSTNVEVEMLYNPTPLVQKNKKANGVTEMYEFAMGIYQLIKVAVLRMN